MNAYNTLMLVPAPASGDINLDGDIDILDIIVTINYILSSQEPDLFYLYKLDLDFSGGINVSDILILLDGII